MSEQKYTPDDPRLTAYVLGELDGAEKTELEKQIASSAELRAAVEELRQAAETVTYALRSEPAGTLSPSRRAEIENAATLAVQRPSPKRRPAANPSRHGAFAAIAGAMVVAVAIAVLVLPPLQDGRYGGSDRSPDSADRADASDSRPAVALWTQTGDETSAEQHDFGDGDNLIDRSQRRILADRPFEQAGLGDMEVADSESTTASGPAPSTSAQTGDLGGVGNRQPASRLSQLYERQVQEQRVDAREVERLREYKRKRDTKKAVAATTKPMPVTPGRRAVVAGAGGATPGLTVTSATGTPPAQASGGASGQGQPGTGKAGAYGYRAGRPGQQGQQNQPVTKPGQRIWQRLSDARQKRASVAPPVELAARNEAGKKNVRESLQAELGFEAPGTEQYAPIVENPFVSPLAEPLSTFSIDVDTASYSNVRRFLTHNQLPPPAAVRIEELVNYFHYDYPEPADGTEPFSVNLEVGPCPWNSGHRLVRVGLKGREIEKSKRPPSNLVFLLDVSGSMRDGNKLPLVKQAMEMLVGEMTEDDRIAIVTYSGSAGLYLDSTSGQDKTQIIDAIHALSAGGSTNGEAGIKLAYQKAVAHFIQEGTNRVILCTDGDFNVGTSDDDELVGLIQEKAKSDVFLSIFGFGMGNLKDAKLEKLADKGNGHYAYIDDIREARKVFVEEMAGTLYTIAKDVKIQIEFNPAQVGAYRLVGYENRVMAAEDFNDDTKDAGEIGAGHTVTALYEVMPPEQLPAPTNVDNLKYQRQAHGPRPVGFEETDGDGDISKELLTLKLRYKLPDADQSTKIEFPLTDDKPRTVMPSPDFEWAASVAGFGMILRSSEHRGRADFQLVEELAQGAVGDDPNERRAEFLQLIGKAKSLLRNHGKQ